MFRFGIPRGEVAGGPPTAAEWTYGLYLMSPRDEIFGIVAWSSESRPWVDAASHGRAALVFDRERGGGQPVAWLDLPALAVTEFEWPAEREPDETIDRRTRTSRDGSALLVSDWFHSEPNTPPDRVRVSKVSLDGRTWTTLIDLLLPDAVGWSDPLRFLELDSGELVTIELGEMWLRSADGEPLRSLSSPSTYCRLERQWPDGRVLASCADPSRAEICWTRGLWLVPLDGSAPELLAMPSYDGACFGRYDDAGIAGGAILIQGSHGEGECEGFVEVPDGTIWRPDGVGLCNAGLVGVRNGAWLVRATGLLGEFGSQCEGPGVLYEIEPDGTTRALTPTELGETMFVPGVMSPQLLASPTP